MAGNPEAAENCMERAARVKIKVVKPFAAYRRSEVIEMDDKAARHLLSLGLAVEERQQSLIETASVEERAERADLTPRRES